MSLNTAGFGGYSLARRARMPDAQATVSEAARAANDTSRIRRRAELPSGGGNRLPDASCQRCRSSRKKF